MTDTPTPSTPVVLRRAPARSDAPLVVLLHGRGSDEVDIMGLADHLPDGPDYVAVRGPVPLDGGGTTWFDNRGMGRPREDSLAASMAWFRGWLDQEAPGGRAVVPVGFSAGAAFTGGLVLADPGRWAGAALLCGTVPFDAGVPVEAGRLQGLPVFMAHGEHDTVIPAELLARTWDYVRDESGAVVESRHDPVGHTLSAEGLQALGAWLGRVLGVG